MREHVRITSDNMNEEKTSSIIAEHLNAMGELGKVGIVVKRDMQSKLFMEKSLVINKWVIVAFPKKTLDLTKFKSL